MTRHDLHPSQIADVEDRLGNAPAVAYPQAVERRTRAIAVLKPNCEVRAGRIFLATGRELYTFGRDYAPVTCGDGSRAWVPRRTTRVESAVIPGKEGASLFQVILVECDTPTIEHRPFVSGPPPQVPAIDAGSCGP